MGEIYPNKNYIIISVGKRHVKAGFSKKTEPFVILQTGELFLKCIDVLEIPRGDISHPKEGAEYVTVLKDPACWRRGWSSLIRRLYTDYLMSNPKDYPVILVERPFFPRELSNHIAQVLVENHQVPGVKRVSEPMVSLFTTGLKTGIVVDIGSSETIVCPVYEGYPIEYNIKIIQCGFDNLKRKFKSELLAQYEESPERSTVEEIDDDIMDDIIFQSGLVDCELTRENDSAVSDFVFENLLVKGRCINLVVNGNTRTKPFEIFFGDEASHNNEGGLAHHIVLDGLVRVLRESNSQVRKELSQNILMCGGLASVPGFERRVSSELQELISTDKQLEPLADHFFLACPPISPFIRSYCGTALMLQQDKPSFNFENAGLQKIAPSRLNSKLSSA